ncbi:MAG: hypothetical protein JWL83_1654, partial [Actinomycetia bacterium]|nr:hypothetical protein [Actinomycetes bacterium]
MPVVAVGCIVAVVTGAVLTLVAGARRTSGAPHAYTAAVGGNADSLIQQRSGRPRTTEVAALPGVGSVESFTFVFAALLDPKHESATDTISFAGSRPFTSRLVAGRAANPNQPYEFVADKTFVADHDARVGSRFHVLTWTRDQGDHGRGFNDKPKGPSFEGVLVGIVDAADKLENNLSTTVFSPALLDEDVGIVTTIMTVRLKPGATNRQLRSELDGLPGGKALSLASGEVISADVRNAVGAQARGTWLMAAVAAAAAVVALGQLLSRHARLSAAERRSLTALGFTRGQVAGEAIVEAAVPAAGGVGVGAVFAVLASGIFPAGFARSLEPKLGLRVDVVALAAGGALLLAALLAWVGMSLLGARRERLERTPSRAGESLARRAPSPAAATGTRFALTNHEGSSTFARSTVVVLAAIVAGVAGSTTFAASLDRLVSDRGRFGSNYTFTVGSNSDLNASDLRTSLARDPDIA